MVENVVLKSLVWVEFSLLDWIKWTIYLMLDDMIPFKPFPSPSLPFIFYPGMRNCWVYLFNGERGEEGDSDDIQTVDSFVRVLQTFRGIIRRTVPQFHVFTEPGLCNVLLHVLQEETGARWTFLYFLVPEQFLFPPNLYVLTFDRKQ